MARSWRGNRKRDAELLARNQAYDDALKLQTQAEKEMQQQDGEVLNLRNQHKTTSVVNRSNRDAMMIEALKSIAERMVDLMADIGNGFATGWEIITSPDYWSEVGQMFQGYWDAAGSVPGGFWTLLTTNPFTTVN